MRFSSFSWSTRTACRRSTPSCAKNEPRHRVVCDYIAGMTDHFLLRQCRELLGAAASGKRVTLTGVECHYPIRCQRRNLPGRFLDNARRRTYNEFSPRKYGEMQCFWT